MLHVLISSLTLKLDMMRYRFTIFELKLSVVLASQQTGNMFIIIILNLKVNVVYFILDKYLCPYVQFFVFHRTTHVNPIVILHYACY